MSSAFAGKLDGYIRYKREELGYEATMEERFYAPDFDEFCRERYPEKKALDSELARAWVSDAKGVSASANRASFMRGFARYLIYEGEEAYVLPSKATPIRRESSIPHLFTKDELAAFFTAADSIPPSRRTPGRHVIAPCCFRLMHCCGLRPKEAREISVRDVDWERGVLRIVDSKDHRDRDVPMNPGVTQMLWEGHQKLEAIFPGREALFPNAAGDGVWSWECMYKAFWMCWEMAGVTEFSGPTPTPYGFRHTFATECIRRWKEQGVDVHGNLRVLQVYMGHAEISSTLYYVHLVRGGMGDPTLVQTWEPTDRMGEESIYG